MLFSQAHFARAPPRAPLYFRCSLVLTGILTGGKRPACYRNRRHGGKRYRCVFLYSVHKETSLRGKMKKMGSRRFRSYYFFKPYSARRDHYATRLLPFFPASLIHGLNEGLFIGYSNGARRMGLLSKSDPENGRNGQRIRRRHIKHQTHCLAFITDRYLRNASNKSLWKWEWNYIKMKFFNIMNLFLSETDKSLFSHAQ